MAGQYGTQVVALEILFFLSIPAGFLLGWRLGALRGSRAWKLWSMGAFVIFGGLMGFVMEGAEGAFWGALCGLPVGFGYGLYAPWIAWRLPSRWGVISAWCGLGILFHLVPLLAAIRLFFGKFDGDDLPFVGVAVFLGVHQAARLGWWQSGELAPSEVKSVLRKHLRAWLDPRAAVIALAFLVPGFATGGCQNLYQAHPGETFRIVLDPSSWWWPVAWIIATPLGLLLAWRKTGFANSAYRLFCLASGMLAAVTLSGHLRFHAVITPETLEIRTGIWRSIEISRQEFSHVETEVSRGKRHVIPYPVLITRDGKRHSLKGLAHASEVASHLQRHWETGR